MKARSSKTSVVPELNSEPFHLYFNRKYREWLQRRGLQHEEMSIRQVNAAGCLKALAHQREQKGTP